MELVSQILAIQSKKEERVSFNGADVAIFFKGKKIGTAQSLSGTLVRSIPRQEIKSLTSSISGSYDLSNSEFNRLTGNERNRQQSSIRGLSAAAFEFDEFLNN
ncbi:hypothetical protein [Bacillus cereus]|uniref:hypothetical protein n=1 Tax=Bacillus cereus TaxID=1396 RepID=UPI000330B050|nr:hypothetical protein [Bacillus cereus]EOO44499.1 hypothetical protein ICK_06274 [Bacillus cereus BAG1X2-2]